MTEIASIVDETPIPAAPEGWFDFGHSPLMDGNLALVRTRMDVHAEYKLWWDAVNDSSPDLRLPEFWQDDIRLSIFDGAKETDVVTVPSGRWPIVDRFADGRWLVASPRADAEEKNGRIYSHDGRGAEAIALGDGIAHLQCSPDGTLWVGYFDEGIFGGSMQDGRWPVSSGGIVRFDASGNVLWSFNDHHQSTPVDDCYAMALSGDALWACFYSDFPIVRLDGSSVGLWSNSITGAKAIAVQDDMVLLAGGYSEDEDRLALIQLRATTGLPLGTLRMNPIDRHSARLLQGRGSTLHIVSGGTWRRTSVGRVASILTS